MSWEALKSAVTAVITANGNEEITGQILQGLINNNLIPQLGSGKFKGIATPTTNPGTPESDIFYFVNSGGVFPNFSGLENTEGVLSIFGYDSAASSWVKTPIFSVPLGEVSEDNTTMPPSGFSVFDHVSKKTTVFDLVKQSKSLGKNLFNKNAVPYIKDSFISSVGTVRMSPSYDIYIVKIEEDTDYWKRFKTSGSYDIFLDGDFNQVGTPTNTFTKTFVASAKYLLISVQKVWLDTYQIEKNTYFSGYEDYIENKPFYNLNNITNPKNVVNVSNTILTEGSYYSDNGVVIDSNYSYIEFLPEYGKAYYISTNGLDSNPSDFNFLTLLDSNDNVIGKESAKSFYKGMFFDIDVKKVIVSSDTELKPFILEEGKGSLGGYSFKGNLVANTQTVFGENNYIKKNVTIKGIVDFTVNGFTDFTFGKGVGTYFSAEVKIDGTNIYIPSIAGGILTYAHGLTITDTLYFILEVDEKWCNLKVSTNGLTFFESITFLFYGDGQTYLESSTDCYVYNANISFRDLQTNVRCYGDSYLTSSDPNRWTFQANSNLNTDFFINNLTGGNSLQLYEALHNDLDFGLVKTIMWCLGMNDNPDIDADTPDPVWLKTILAVKKLCRLTGIEMVACTIPDVPSRYHFGKTKYIYNELNIRYADFAGVVDNKSNYNWFSRMLATDDVHPTAKGAFTLALEAVRSVPELYK